MALISRGMGVQPYATGPIAACRLFLSSLPVKIQSQLGVWAARRQPYLHFQRSSNLEKRNDSDIFNRGCWDGKGWWAGAHVFFIAVLSSYPFLFFLVIQSPALSNIK